MAGGEFEDPTDNSDRDLDAGNELRSHRQCGRGMVAALRDAVCRARAPKVDGFEPFDMDVEYLQFGGTVSYPDAETPTSFRTSA